MLVIKDLHSDISDQFWLFYGYKYKGGNYLLWLEEIVYAEDPKYIIAVENVLRGL